MLYAVGDVHGQKEMLARMLKSLEPRLRAGDRIVFVGDYIDRGPDSAGVIEELLEVSGRHPSTLFLRGNHEQMMLDARAQSDPEWAHRAEAIRHDALRLWFANGGEDTLASYPGIGRGGWWRRVPEDHWEFLDQTRLEWEHPPFHFVHAGIEPDGVEWPYADEGLDPRLWIRDEFLHSDSDFGGRIVVFGHTPMEAPLVEAHRIGIDTGAAYGGPLTTVALSPEAPGDPEFFQITP
jgi:serine/threonine protein phosphatase 1